MARIRELDAIRGLAIIIVVLFHSSLTNYNPDLFYCLVTFALASFIFVSGFLSYSGLKNTKRFISDRVKSIYIPFLVFLIAIYFFNLQVYNLTDPTAYIYHASFLSVFQSSQSYPGGIYNLSAFWFIPCLLVYFLLFALVRNDKAKIVLSIMLFTANFISWTHSLDLIFEWRFTEFLVIFTLGYFIAKYQVLTRKYFYLASLFMSLIATLCVLLPIEQFNGLSIDRFIYVTVWETVFTIASVLTIIVYLSYIRFKGLELLGRMTLYIYLLEPFIRYFVESYTSNLALELAVNFTVILFGAYTLTNIKALQRRIASTHQIIKTENPEFKNKMKIV